MADTFGYHGYGMNSSKPVFASESPYSEIQPDEYFDPEIETLTRAALRQLQEAKLARQLDYLYARSPVLPSLTRCLAAPGPC